MTTTVSKAYTATGNSAAIAVKDKNSLTYVVTGTFVGTWVVEYTWDQTNYFEIATGTSTQTSVTWENSRNDTRQVWVRTRCSAYTSGTLTAAIADVKDPIPEVDDVIDNDGVTLLAAKDEGYTTIRRVDQQYLITSGAKVGGTAGAVVDAANDKGSLVKVPASQTASTVVVKVPFLKVGWIITGVGIIGQIESGGNTATVDCILRAQTAVAAGLTDAAIGSGITQVSVTADTVIDDEETGLSHTVIDTEGYYILLTVTTAALTDVDVQGVYLTVTEV